MIKLSNFCAKNLCTSLSDTANRAEGGTNPSGVGGDMPKSTQRRAPRRWDSRTRPREVAVLAQRHSPTKKEQNLLNPQRPLFARATGLPPRGSLTKPILVWHQNNL